MSQRVLTRPQRRHPAKEPLKKRPRGLTRAQARARRPPRAHRDHPSHLENRLCPQSSRLSPLEVCLRYLRSRSLWRPTEPWRQPCLRRRHLKRRRRTQRTVFRPSSVRCLSCLEARLLRSFSQVLPSSQPGERFRCVERGLPQCDGIHSLVRWRCSDSGSSSIIVDAVLRELFRAPHVHLRLGTRLGTIACLLNRLVHDGSASLSTTANNTRC